MRTMHRVAVIGAGAAGLAAAKQLSEHPQNFECCVFEQADQVGGTWVYTDHVGQDEFGLPVHSSMYKGLRTNLPKEVMGYPDFPVPENPKSYVTSAEILNFLESYARKFDIMKHIKFRYHVRNVRPLPNDRWQLEVVNLLSEETEIAEFDAVMVCNGHYNTPYVPAIKGDTKFGGKILHSHDYRDSKPFAGKRVLVIGAGPSGMDLTLDISSYATKVILSHHWPDAIDTQFPKNVRMTSDIVELGEDNAKFKDGTTEEIDIVFYCTGYNYNFPFLSLECGITVQDNCVEPLYKHLIHIDKPTMCFIGIPFYACIFSLSDLQSRFFLKTLDGSFQLPSRDVLIEDTKKEKEWRSIQGLEKRKSHLMGSLQGAYYEDLAKTAGLKPLPPVLAKLHNESSQRFIDDLCNYREDIYRIIDENTYKQIS